LIRNPAFGRSAQGTRGLSLIAGLLLVGCTDAATRVAYDLEEGSKKLTGSGALTYTVDHAPSATPDGCAGPYTLQLSRESSLLVWCNDPVTGKPVASHTTTYHLDYVGVPTTFIVEKRAGEHAFILLAREGSHIVVTGLQ
jgi:hypothetical protein